MAVPRKDRNIVDLVGEVASDPVHRRFESGAELVSFTVRTRLVVGDSAVTENIPVAWWSADCELDRLAPGSRVHVLGRVHRRFYTGVGGLRSVVEVVAVSVDT